MKIIQGIAMALILGFGGWMISTVYALDKSYNLVEFRLQLVEENYKMLKDIWEESGHGE